jgi:hypothetical protein
MWSDRSEEPLVINVEVTPLLIAKPTEGKKTFVYNGEEQTYTAIAGDDNTAYYSSLSYTAKDADSYTFQVTLNQPTNTRWADGSIEDISFTFTIEKLSIAIPAEDTSSFYYTGEAQTYHIEENKYYQVTNNVQTEAGQYTVVVSLIDDNVQWADGTRNNITYTFLLSAVKELSLMWLIGVLTFILLLELLVGNVYWLETKKKQDKELQRRGITTNALGGITPLLLTVYYIPTWQVVLVVVLVVAIMAVAIYNVFRALRESEEVKEDDNFILSHVVSHMQAHTYAQRYVTYMPVISDENIDKEGKVPKQLPEEAVDEQPLLEEGNAKLTEGKQETLTDQMVDDYIDDYLKNHQDDYFPPAEAQPLSEDRAQEGQAQPLLQEEAQKLDKKRIAMSEATPRLTAEATSQEGSQKGLAVPKGGNLVAQTNGFTKEKSAPSKKSRKSQKKDSKDKE